MTLIQYALHMVIFFGTGEIINIILDGIFHKQVQSRLRKEMRKPVIMPIRMFMFYISFILGVILICMINARVSIKL